MLKWNLLCATFPHFRAYMIVACTHNAHTYKMYSIQRLSLPFFACTFLTYIYKIACADKYQSNKILCYVQSQHPLLIQNIYTVDLNCTVHLLLSRVLLGEKYFKKKTNLNGGKKRWEKIISTAGYSILYTCYKKLQEVIKTQHSTILHNIFILYEWEFKSLETTFKKFW